MTDKDFQIISDSTYSIFKKRMPSIEEINDGFCIYKNHFTDIEEPNMIIYLDDYITQVASPNFTPPFFPIDYAVDIEENTHWISIGLNWFLGSDHPFYQSIPDYFRLRYDSIYIAPMVFHQLGDFYIKSNIGTSTQDIDFNATLLESMISTAKPYFFAQEMLPGAADYRIFGFTKEEMNFVYENESFL